MVDLVLRMLSIQTVDVFSYINLVNSINSINYLDSRNLQTSRKQ